MYNCIIVDDEKLARERIRCFIDTQVNWQVIAEVGEYREALACIQQQKPDVCFLDINIIGGSGVELAQELNQRLNSQWVFTTAYSEFALKAFELDAIDYLLKPFEDCRLRDVLNKLEKRILKPIERKHTLAVKSIGAVQFVNVDEIIWIKGSANYVELHCQEKMLLHRETLANLEQFLDPLRFVRVHRSAMVNIDKIDSLTSELGRYSLLHLSNGDEVKISQSHKHSLFNHLGLEPV